jgi:hypothetical protein
MIPKPNGSLTQGQAGPMAWTRATYRISEPLRRRAPSVRAVPRGTALTLGDSRLAPGTSARGHALVRFAAQVREERER